MTVMIVGGINFVGCWNYANGGQSSLGRNIRNYSCRDTFMNNGAIKPPPWGEVIKGDDLFLLNFSFDTKLRRCRKNLWHCYCRRN